MGEKRKEPFSLQSLYTHKRLWAVMGALLGLSAPGYGAWFLAWVGLIPAFILLKYVKTPWQAFLLGTCLGVGYHATYMAWYWGLHPLDWMGFSQVQSLLIAAMGWGVASVSSGLYVGGAFGLYRILSPRLPKGLQVIAFPLLWAGCFWLFCQTEIGVPWSNLEYTQHQHQALRTLVGLLCQVGLPGGMILTGLILAYNMLGAVWLQCGERTVRKQVLKGLLWVGMPFLLLWVPPNPSIDPPLQNPIRVLQGNLSIDVIRTPSLARRGAQQAYLSVLEGDAIPPNSLIILPEEGAIPTMVREESPFDNREMRQLVRLAQEKNLTILSGLSTLTGTGPHNSLMALSPDGSRPLFYHKRRLVPFGETTPYLDPAWIQAFLAPWGIDYATGFEPGKKASLLEIQHPFPLRIGGLICFELLYPELAQDYQAAGAEVLINVSNLGWFHGNSLMEAQFLAMAQFRAAETGLPVIVATNSGVSAIINASGTLLKQSPSQQPSLLITP